MEAGYRLALSYLGSTQLEKEERVLTRSLLSELAARIHGPDGVYQEAIAQWQRAQSNMLRVGR
jgi:hypothetical protein